MAMTIENKDSIPGFIYLVDNGVDYKIGLTNNPVRRGSSYVTENPRNKVIDCIQVSTYREAEQVEQELIRKMRHLNAFTNSKEWQKRCPEVVAIWNSVTSKYSGGAVFEDHSKVYERARKLERELEATKQKLSSANQAKAKAEDTFKAAEDFYNNLWCFFKNCFLWSAYLVACIFIFRTAPFVYQTVCQAYEQRIELEAERAALEAKRIEEEAEAEVDRRLALADHWFVYVNDEKFYISKGSVYKYPKSIKDQRLWQDFRMPKPKLENELFWKCLDEQVISKLPKAKQSELVWNSAT
jgi:hypothetical protein